MMDDILNNVSSISWWFGVVFVGVMVSLIASYLKPHTDNWLANYSKSRKDKNENEKCKWVAEVERLGQDESYRALFTSRVTHEHGKSTFIMLSGVAMFLFGGMFPFLLQIPHMTDTESTTKFVELMENLPVEQISILVRLLFYLLGSLSLLVGMTYLRSSEKLMSQLEEAVGIVDESKIQLNE